MRRESDLRVYKKPPHFQANFFCVIKAGRALVLPQRELNCSTVTWLHVPASPETTTWQGEGGRSCDDVLQKQQSARRGEQFPASEHYPGKTSSSHEVLWLRLPSHFWRRGFGHGAAPCSPRDTGPAEAKKLEHVIWQWCCHALTSGTIAHHLPRIYLSMSHWFIGPTNSLFWVPSPPRGCRGAPSRTQLLGHSKDRPTQQQAVQAETIKGKEPGATEAAHLCCY